MLYEDIYEYNKEIDKTISHNFIIDAEESNRKEYEEYEEYCINEDTERLNIDEFMASIEEFHKREDEENYEVRLKDEGERIKVRDKVNNLRKLRLNDLDKLREMRRDRGEDFTDYMDRKYRFLYCQYIDNLKNIDLYNCERSKKYFNAYRDEIEKEVPCKYSCEISFDCRRFTNKTLIKTFNITSEEQQFMKSIISREEIKRRKNLKRRQCRRDCNGLTKRERIKLEKEKKIQDLIVSDPKITKSEVARIMGLDKSTITRCYSHLF